MTVFAPNDLAFIKLARDLGYEGSDEGEAWLFLVDVLTELGGEAGPIPILTEILLYHVAPERISPFDLIVRTIFRNDIETLLPDATIRPRFLKLKDNDRDFRDPRVRIPFNIHADNGVIHTINRVLIPVDLP